MKKTYQVIFVDEYDNWFELGIYKSLKDAEADVNAQLKGYKLLEDDEVDPGATPRFGTGDHDNQGELEEYAGTCGPVFDRIIPVEEGSVQVRGFVRYDGLKSVSANKIHKKIKDYKDCGYKADQTSKVGCGWTGIVASAAQYNFGAADALEELAKELEA